MNLAFNVTYSQDARKTLKKLDKSAANRILTWIEERLIGCENPRLWGAALVGEFSGLWKYRIGDYRLICQIKDNELTILVLDLSNRKEVYR